MSEPGFVYITARGVVGAGKSAVLGAIERVLEERGLRVHYEDEDAANLEKNSIDLDTELQRIQPTVILIEERGSWRPESDCSDLSVPEMLVHIFKNRPSMARAPNNHTCPFLTIEEWDRIAKWAETYLEEERAKAAWAAATLKNQLPKP